MLLFLFLYNAELRRHAILTHLSPSTIHQPGTATISDTALLYDLQVPERIVIHNCYPLVIILLGTVYEQQHLSHIVRVVATMPHNIGKQNLDAGLQKYLNISFQDDNITI